MNNELHLNRRQFLRSTGQAATTLAAASAFAPAILSAESPTKTIGVGCIGLGTRGGDLINHGTGYAGDLLSHEMDFVQYLLGHGIPDNCVCSGLTALLRDDREVPDTWVATYQFEKLGRTVTFEGSMNATDSQPVTICGRDATLRFDAIAHNVSKFEIVPADHNQKADLPKGYVRGQTPAQPNHIVDWLNCIRSRGTPKCSTDEAFIETATFLMSLKAQQERRMVRWDAAKEEIV